MESLNSKKEEREASAVESIPAIEKRSDRIWAERNLEKWPAIWQPARANTKPEARHIERQIELSNGKRVNAKVKVGFTDEGVLTTEDQKTYYALVKQWQEKDNASEQVIPFSIRKLAKLLQKNGWGTNVIESITNSLKKLRVTPFTWTNSYRDAVTGEVLEEIELFNILSDLKIIRRKTDGHITYQGGYYRFNDFLMKNLLARHTKPVLFDTILRFKSDIAQLLYTHIDLMLFDKRQYERRTKELFADLGLTGQAYKHAANRKQKLLRALEELRGVRLTSGWISDASIERIKDGKGYKVIFKKSSTSRDFDVTTVGELNRPALEANPVYITQHDEITAAASDLIRAFHKAFHSVENHNPQTKELNQAISLIATHGIEQAKCVIEFSREAAEQTRYKPQTFGGILQYTSRAIAHYEKRRLAERQKQQAQSDEADQRAKQDAREQERSRMLEGLSSDDYRDRFEHAKRTLFMQSPWLASKEGSEITQKMIRSVIADQLEREHIEDERPSIDSDGKVDSPPSVVSHTYLLPPPSGLNLTS